MIEKYFAANSYFEVKELYYHHNKSILIIRDQVYKIICKRYIDNSGVIRIKNITDDVLIIELTDFDGLEIDSGQLNPQQVCEIAINYIRFSGQETLLTINMDDGVINND